jgi:hypothetical protein
VQLCDFNFDALGEQFPHGLWAKRSAQVQSFLMPVGNTHLIAIGLPVSCRDCSIVWNCPNPKLLSNTVPSPHSTFTAPESVPNIIRLSCCAAKPEMLVTY